MFVKRWSATFSRIYFIAGNYGEVCQDIEKNGLLFFIHNTVHYDLKNTKYIYNTEIKLLIKLASNIKSQSTTI